MKSEVCFQIEDGIVHSSLLARNICLGCVPRPDNSYTRASQKSKYIVDCCRSSHLREEESTKRGNQVILLGRNVYV